MPPLPSIDPRPGTGVVLGIDAIRSAGRNLKGPFRLQVIHAGVPEAIHCAHVLRVLPSTRIVCDTEWKGQPAIAKIFLKRRGAHRDFHRELKGLRTLFQAGIPAPRVLAECLTVDGGQPVLIFEMVAPAENFSRLFECCPDADSRLALVQKAVAFIAKQHEAGICQQDLHLGNLLCRNDAFHAIDGATVRVSVGGKPLKLTAGLKNLGIFLAQLPVVADELLPAVCDMYVRARGLEPGAKFLSQLARAVNRSRARRLQTILRKATRNCTEIVRFASNGLSIYCRREHDSLELRRVLAAPDEAIAQGFSLKNGNSATTALIQVGGRKFVIKRYNVNRLIKAVQNLFGQGRARRAWRNAHLLEALGIATAKPIGLIERRYGPLSRAAYFVSEFVPGECGRKLFQRTNLTAHEARTVANTTATLLARLHQAAISHGDLKATNLIYQSGEPILIDLDFLRQHRTWALLHRRHVRDCRRLLRNFKASSLLYRDLARRIGEHVDGLSSGDSTRSQEHTIRRKQLRVRYRFDSPVPMMSANILDRLENSSQPAHTGVEVLKFDERRSLFRIDSGGFPAVVKAFPFERAKHKLRWKRYSLAEFRNIQIARRLGISTPFCYAMFWIRRFGLVQNCGLVLESLSAHSDPASLSANDQRESFRAIPVLAQFYLCGVNHLDVSPSNLLFHKETGRAVVIDWQYCAFLTPRNNVQLVMQAAHFLKFAGIAPANPLWSDWIAEMHRQSGTDLALFELERSIRAAQGAKLRIRDRLRANLRALSAEHKSRLQAVRGAYCLFRWRWRAKKKHCVGLSVSNIAGLLQRLAENQISVVVLRWFEDVPRTPLEEHRYELDVDLLVEGGQIEKVVSLAADQPGRVRCDLYSTTGQRGATFAGIPYYPPAFAEALLADRELYDSRFLVPRPESHFRSLAYHLVYHKGLASGIASGCHLISDPRPKREYGRLIAEVAKSAGIGLEDPVTLRGLHQHLKQCDWDVPFDLLVRWPKQTSWHQWLLDDEKELLRPWAEALPHALVFFIREDAAEKNSADAVCRMLSERFRILAIHELSPGQSGRVMRKVRGGDWLEHGKTTVVRPKIAVICYDLHPVTVGIEQLARATQRKSKNPYPLVKNANIFFKHEIRRRLQQMSDGVRICGIHGSDDAYESQHMIRTIYGKGYAAMNRQFAAKLLKGDAVARPRKAA